MAYAPTTTNMLMMRELNRARNQDALQEDEDNEARMMEEEARDEEEQALLAEEAALQNDPQQKEKEIRSQHNKLAQELGVAATSYGGGLALSAIGAKLLIVLIGFPFTVCGWLGQYFGKNKLLAVFQKEKKLIAEAKKYNVKVKPFQDIVQNPVKGLLSNPNILVAFISGAGIAVLFGSIIALTIAFLPIALVTKIPILGDIISAIVL